MIRILIVEDEKPISNLIRLSLTKAGYHCTCVYDGNAAVDKLDREIFDLILLDIMLPGANGFELMDYIRPLGIPVIFLTAVNSVGIEGIGFFFVQRHLKRHKNKQTGADHIEKR